jgi:hypothetical protein
MPASPARPGDGGGLRRAATLALGWWIAALAAVGCFEDSSTTTGDGSGASDSGSSAGSEATSSASASSGSGGSGSTTATPCEPGALGCDCYPNQTCNTGLECAAGNCQQVGCTQGSLNCGCFEGMCFGELVCDGGVCRPDTGGTSTGTTSASGGSTGATCSPVIDCDGNLCTQGDELCDGACEPGAAAGCPTNAVCDQSTGSCVCTGGFQSCEGTCIPETDCCTDDECVGDETCTDRACVCPVDARQCPQQGGPTLCILGAECCPGDTSGDGCSCGGRKTCQADGRWGDCGGGNNNPECNPGSSVPCGACGTQRCQDDCRWGACEGGGVCAPGSQQCVQGKLETCQPSCTWMQTGSC